MIFYSIDAMRALAANYFARFLSPRRELTTTFIFDVADLVIRRVFASLLAEGEWHYACVAPPVYRADAAESR